MIDEFLKKYNLTRYQVAKISGVTASTLQTATENEVNKMTVKTLQALAMATGLTAGQVLDELIALNGNTIIKFIQAHPFLDKQLVQDIENKMIELNQKGINLKTVTFNRYYDEVQDTNENAEKALSNLLQMMNELEDDLGQK